MLERMKLSAAESKGIRMEMTGRAKGMPTDPQAVGKVLAQKIVNADGLAHALGRI
jgi:hypothetical protein